jgi:hypothetical protein
LADAWKRGAAIAVHGSSPKASVRSVTCAMAGWMYCDPAAPITRRTLSPSSMSVGDMVLLA